MPIAMALYIATLLAGSEGPAASGPDADLVPAAAAPTSAEAEQAVSSAPEIAYRVRYLSVGNIGWRSRFAGRLEPVERHEGIAIWQADNATLADLLDDVQASPHGNVLQAPVARAPLGKPISVAHEEVKRYVAEMKRRPAGADGQAAKRAFEPSLGEVRDGLRLRVASSRLMTGGLIAQITIEDNRVLGFHTEMVSAEGFEAPGTQPSASRSGYTPPLNRLFRTVGGNRTAGTVHATIQVPEVVSSRVEGEWLIPTDGALVVSLGPCSMPAARHAGREAYEERLVVLAYAFAGDEPAGADPAVREASATIRKAPAARP